MSFVMKDGSVVADRRLGRLVNFDKRRMMYPVMGLVGDNKKPRSYTWRCLKVLDQLSEGSCVGHGVAHRLISKPSENSHIDHAFATEQIYYQAQQIDEWPGGGYPGAQPFYEGTSVEAGAKVAQRGGFIEGYYWAHSIDEMIIGIGYQGPAVIGVEWREGMFNTDSSGFIHATGDSQGGHCVCITGVNVKKGYFYGVNSWGRSWGLKGFFKISFTDMAKLLANNGEVCFFVGEKVLKP